MKKPAIGRLSAAFALLFVFLTIFYVGFLFTSPRTVTNLLYCCSHRLSPESMARTYCVIVPLHPDKRTHGGFYVRLPKHLKFDGEEWECGLHGLVYRHVWPPALVEADTHMELHLENGEKYRLPVDLDANLTPEKLREAISKAGEHALDRYFNPPSTSPPPELVLTTTYDGSTSPPRPKREGTFILLP